jgi:hypothetical protein
LGFTVNSSSNSNYRLWNDTGHGAWVSITGQGGAILPAGASAQTAIYPVEYGTIRKPIDFRIVVCIFIKVS